VLQVEKELLMRLRVVPSQLSLNASYFVGRSSRTAKGKTMLRKSQEYVPQTSDKNKQFKGSVLRCSISEDEATLVLSGTKAIKEAGYCSSSVYKAVKSGSLYKGYLWLRVEPTQQEI
jgi:hypothetical protein